MSRGRKKGKVSSYRLAQKLFYNLFTSTSVSIEDYRAMYVVNGMIAMLLRGDSYTKYYGITDAARKILHEDFNITDEDIKRKSIIIIWEYNEQSKI